MKTNEYDYYNDLANWSFEDINYTTETLTNWIYEDEIIKRINKDSKVLDLGTAAGEKLLKNFPDCAEILGTDYSKEMIENAKKNLEKSGRKNISFRVMDNLKMDTPNDYFDLVTARHTVIEPKQIYKTLKENGQLVIRGVDKLDCWALKRKFGRGQGYHDTNPISLIDYEAIMDAGFKDVELVPIHVREFYKTKDDLIALLMKTPILDDFQNKELDLSKIDEYVKTHTYEKGILLIRRYYGISARKE